MVEFGERGHSTPTYTPTSITPWSVEGTPDYERLIEEFGTNKIDDALLERMRRLAGEDHYMLRRRIFFSHRDLGKALDDYEAGRGFFLYTGRGPSGPMHIGHILPLYFAKWLQDRFGANLYIQLTDDEKFLERKERLSLEEARRWAYENALDAIAVGFDPDRTFIFQNTEYAGNMYPLALRIASRINFSVVRAVFGFTEQTNVGLVFFPSLQIVPTMFERRRCLIPAAIDQDPYWRVQRDVAEPLGYFKAAAIHSRFMPPLTGFSGKMSTSRPETAIYLTDDPKIVRRKITRYAFSGGQPTIELHRRRGGDPDVDVSYQWLYMFFEPDDSKMKRIREDYESGALLSGELKEILIDRLTLFLEGHQERREMARDLVDVFTKEGELASEMWKRKYGV